MKFEKISESIHVVAIDERPKTNLRLGSKVAQWVFVFCIAIIMFTSAIIARSDSYPQVYQNRIDTQRNIMRGRAIDTKMQAQIKSTKAAKEVATIEKINIALYIGLMVGALYFGYRFIRFHSMTSSIQFAATVAIAMPFIISNILSPIFIYVGAETIFWDEVTVTSWVFWVNKIVTGALLLLVVGIAVGLLEKRHNEKHYS